ncbi:hypothetical protein AcW1_010290 [Taiwanofungus camphoratus]|nr:hypothetical protein AcW1_010290 [Antrodia cinnamomea]
MYGVEPPSLCIGRLWTSRVLGGQGIAQGYNGECGQQAFERDLNSGVNWDPCISETYVYHTARAHNALQRPTTLPIYLSPSVSFPRTPSIHSRTHCIPEMSQWQRWRMTGITPTGI